MKTLRSCVALVSLAGLAIRLPAQAIQDVLVLYGQNRVQTGSSTTVAASGTPFFFQVSVEGDGSVTDTFPITAATVTLPNATSLGLSPPTEVGGGKWMYVSSSYADATSLQGAFANGTYTMNLTPATTGYGATTALLGSISSSVLNAPLVGLTSTGGSWGGGAYNFTVGQNITVSFNNISSGGSDQFHYDVHVNGPNTNGNGLDALVTAGSAAPNYTIDTSAFIAGQTYTLEVDHDDIYSLNSNTYAGNPANIFTAGLYEIRSTITLYAAIPEPSTYAAIFGAVALAGVMLLRRRRQA